MNKYHRTAISTLPSNGWVRSIAHACGMLALCTIACAAGAADLIAVYREAQSQDAVYGAARASYQAGQEKVPQARAGLLAGISASGYTLYNDRDLQLRSGSIANGAQRYNSNGVSVTATQPLFRMQNWIGYQQAQTQVSQTEATFLQSQQDLILRVAQSYFDVLLAESNVRLAAAQKTAYDEQLAQAKRNFEVGTATITDANDAQARRDLAVSQEIAARNDLDLKKEALRQIIGRAPPELANLSARFAPALPNPQSTEQWVERAFASSLQVRIANAALEIATQEVDKNRSGHLPTVDAVAAYSDTGSGAGLQGGPGYDVTTKYIGLQLTVPIYMGGALNSRVREALANQDKARLELEYTKRTVALNTRTAYLGTLNGAAQITALQTALVSSQSSLDSSKLGQEVGVRTQVDVLNATQQLISARRDYAQATYAYTISALKLKAAAGTLSEDDLTAINQWLEK